MEELETYAITQPEILEPVALKTLSAVSQAKHNQQNRIEWKKKLISDLRFLHMMKNIFDADQTLK